jgi:flavin reductase (DIM6/NTAB) family NADH-FMN oxidoreductase RutF
LRSIKDEANEKNLAGLENISTASEAFKAHGSEQTILPNVRRNSRKGELSETLSEKAFFRHVMGQFTTGVTIVTTATNEGFVGLTVNAFTSVSLRPPLVLICIDTNSHTLPYLRASGSFAVNMLTSEQEELSYYFASLSVERSTFFRHAPYHVAVTGSPILDGVLAFIDARIVMEYPGGDHVIILGQVQAMGTNGKAQFLNANGTMHDTLITWGNEETDSAPQPEQPPKAPLLYHCGQYRHLVCKNE